MAKVSLRTLSTSKAFYHTRNASPARFLNPDDHFDQRFLFMAMKGRTENENAATVPNQPHQPYTTQLNLSVSTSLLKTWKDQPNENQQRHPYIVTKSN
jgi:hypothetical protein